MFSDKEVTYLASQRLARIATISTSMQPDVSPVGFQFDGERFIVSGHNVERTRKYRSWREMQRWRGLCDFKMWLSTIPSGLYQYRT